MPVAAVEARSQALGQGGPVDTRTCLPPPRLCPQLTLCIEELSVFVQICQEQAIHERGFAQTRLS